MGSECIQSRSQQAFSRKDGMVVTLGFTGYPVSVATTQLCSRSVKAATEEEGVGMDVFQ